MKQKNTILSTLAPALLLLAATLCVAGCSQTDDAPADAALAARGGEPLHIRIAPKPGYTDADPSTRSKVDGATGKFSWEKGDRVNYHITFNDGAGTIVKQVYSYDAVGNWYQEAKWIGDSGEPVVWPMGASSATVLACYTDSRKRISDADNTVYFADTQETGKGVHAVYSGTLSFGNVLDIKLKHATTRFEFAGLEPNTAYTIANATYFKEWHVEKGFQNGVPASFITDASGNAITYGQYSGTPGADGKFNLELQKDGTTVYTTTLQAQGTAGDWKTNGYIYKINMKKGGGVNPDNNVDLIIPSYKGKKPNLLAISGQDAYWIAPENAMEDVEWKDIDFNTVCPDGWYVPTLDDFKAMTGFPADDSGAHTENIDALLAVFPGGNGSYWSSTVHLDSGVENGAWELIFYQSTSAGLMQYSFGYVASVRCVRKK